MRRRISAHDKKLLLAEMIQYVDGKSGKSSIVEAFNLLVLRGIELDVQIHRLDDIDWSDFIEFLRFCLRLEILSNIESS